MNWLSGCGRATRQLVLSLVILLGCLSIIASGGGGDGDGETHPLTGGGVKGPLANADVAAYLLDTSQADFKASSALDTGTTNTAAAITGLNLPNPLNPPYILEFTSNANTVDLTTCATPSNPSACPAPVITTMRTVLTQEMLDSGAPIYATPLTTMATDMAIRNAGSGATAQAFLAAWDTAKANVLSTLGFGASADIDIAQTPPLMNATTDTQAEQLAAAKYRAAVEAVTAIVYQMNQTASGTTPDAVLSELSGDLADGLIDGTVGGQTSTILDSTALAVLDQEPDTLPIPNDPQNRTVGDVEDIVADETSQTGGPSVDPAAIPVQTKPAQTNPDMDGDGYLNVNDAFPNDASEWLDTDGDGIGNNADSDDDNDGVPDASDAFPLDSTEWLDTDGDGTGNNADNDDDNDGTPDANDDFPLDMTRQHKNDQDNDGWDALYDPDDTDNTNPGTPFADVDPDGDGIPNDVDTDDDGDGVPDSNDAFPLDASESADLDNDGTGDNSDDDIDGDGVLNSADAYPRDATADTDTDGDGKPDVAYTDASRSTIDTARSDPDDDNDGLSDEQEDALGTDPLKRDSDGDGRLDKSDAFPLDSTEWLDTDGDGTGNNADTDDDNDGLSDAEEASLGTKPLVADTDGDTLTDGEEVNGTPATNPLSKDTDGDTYNDNADNCPATSNDQTDTNGNGKGDACDGVPTAVADTASTDEDTPVTTGDVLANDTDPEGDTLNIVSADTSSTNGGSVSDNGDGTFTYTPALNFNGSDTFTYTISDGTPGTSATGTVTITVNAVNDAPVAADDTASTGPSSDVVIDVRANDSDADGDTLVVTAVGSVSGSSGGSVQISNNGADVTYSPGASAGTDSFSYTVSDGHGGTDTAMVTVTVSANQSPTANDDTASTDEDTPVTTGDVLANDTDPENDTLSIVNADSTSAQGGSVSNNGDGTFTYTPVQDFNGADSFNYTISDGTSQDSATVNITVNPVNDVPVAADDTASTEVGSDVVIDVRGNDSDADNDTLTVTAVGSVSGSSGGSVQISNNGANVTYTPGSSAGTDSFSYTVSDGNGGTDTATVTVTVTSTTIANFGGVWKLTSTVASLTPQVTGGCDNEQVGNTETNNYVTVSQSGNAVQLWSMDGVHVTGSVNTTTEEANMTGTFTMQFPDLDVPSDDTATYDVSIDLQVDLQKDSATSVSGSARFEESHNGTLVCIKTEDLSGQFIYHHSGSEDYDGSYALEIKGDQERSSDYGGGVTYESSSIREALYIEFDFSANDITLGGLDSGDTLLDTSFDPTTGYFTFTIESTTLRDENGDGVTDWSEIWTNNVHGIMLRDPTDPSANQDGTPLVAFNIRDSSRNYDGNFAVPRKASIGWSDGYGKHLTTSGYHLTMTYLGGDNSTGHRVLMGVFNPPLTRTSDTSKLFIQVLDTNGTTPLCAVDFENRPVQSGTVGGFFSQVLEPDPVFENEAFRDTNYALAYCDPSNDNTTAIADGGIYTVRVMDTGADGLLDGTADTVLYTQAVTYGLPDATYSEGIQRADISFNGSQASRTLSGVVTPVAGFFDPDEEVYVSWSSHAEGADGYELFGANVTSAPSVVHRLATTGTNATMPAGSLNEDDLIYLRLSSSLEDGNGDIAQAISSRVVLTAGVYGLFNVELGSALPYEARTFQVFLEGNSSGVDCIMPSGVWPAACSSASLDYSNNLVILSMSDSTGVYTGTPGGSFTLILHFTDAAHAEVISPDSIPGVPTSGGGSITAAATLANNEFYIRSHRLSHNGAERTRFDINNAIATLEGYTKAVLLRDDGGDMGGGVTSHVVWDDVAGTPYTSIVTEQIVMPTDDGEAQTTKHVAGTNSRDILGSNMLMPGVVYRLVLSDEYPDNGTLPTIAYRATYTAPAATDYIAPSVENGDTVTINGTLNCSSTATTCNDPDNPVTVSGSSAVSLEWPVDSAVPSDAYWRVVFRNAATPNLYQLRTPWMANGDYGLSINAGSATWTNPGDIDLPSGDYSVSIFVGNGPTGEEQTLQGTTSRNSSATGASGDNLFIHIP